MTVTDFLQSQVPFLNGLSAGQARALAVSARQQTYAKGQTVVFKGTTLDGLYVVASGKVEVWAQAGKQKALSKVAEPGPGEVFGEMSILGMGKAGATVKALEDETLVFLIPHEAFREVMAQNPQFQSRMEGLAAVDFGRAQAAKIEREPMPRQRSFQDEWLAQLVLTASAVPARAVASLRREEEPYLANLLVERQFLTPESLGNLVQGAYGIPFLIPSDTPEADKFAVSLIPAKICRALQLVPLRMAEEKLEILMANPLDQEALTDIRVLSGRELKPYFCLQKKVENLIQAFYSEAQEALDLLKKVGGEEPVELVGTQEAMGESPMANFVDSIISKAVRLRASDIHIEQEKDSTVLRFRIDGILSNIMTIPKDLGAGPVISRIKVMASLDLAERRKPQDGRARLMVGGHELAVRVSILPTAHGEKAVLRLLDRRQAEIDIESLGFRPELRERVEALLRSPHGMLLVTGPTGSGKTTTLYAFINEIRSEHTNIVTIEDPIEYKLEGVNQVQVNEKAGLTFPNALRSVLRQDPDLILVGEIRDRETEEIAFQASLTGHFVFSTLHSNDTISTIARLLDIGAERYKIAPTLIAIISQQLVRRICPKCKREMPVSGMDQRVPALAERLGIPLRSYAGQGCAHCAYTGYYGRLCIAEFLEFDEKARDLLITQNDNSAFRSEALKQGWLIPLAVEALWHVSQGDTTVEEVSSLIAAELKPFGSAPRPAVPAQAPEKDILVVEDDESTRALLKLALEKGGYSVREAAGGQEALAGIARAKPDLLLTDLMMPGMDGMELIRSVRGGIGLLGIPIMVLTAMEGVESQEQALALGADDYLSKPLQPKIVLARVNALLRRIKV